MAIYEPGQVSLVGTEMEPAKPSNEGHVKVYSDLTHLLKLECDPIRTGNGKGDDLTMALIYGYMFEGHTYQMTKPRIMVVGGKSHPYEPGTSGKCIDPQSTGVLKVWCLNRSEETVSIVIESGTVETLILEANTPGAGSRASYASHMQTAHRGGKLS